MVGMDSSWEVNGSSPGKRTLEWTIEKADEVKWSGLRFIQEEEATGLYGLGVRERGVKDDS